MELWPFSWGSHCHPSSLPFLVSSRCFLASFYLWLFDAQWGDCLAEMPFSLSVSLSPEVHSLANNISNYLMANTVLTLALHIKVLNEVSKFSIAIPVVSRLIVDICWVLPRLSYFCLQHDEVQFENPWRKFQAKICKFENWIFFISKKEIFNYEWIS